MKFNRQTVFTVVIGFMLLTWVMGTALSSNLMLSSNEVRIESVYERLLTPQEKITILRSGRVLIEYLHTGGFETVERKAAYENFAARFKDNVIIQVVEISEENQTMDRMITPTGDIVPLENVSSADLFDVFCENSFVQPKECLLRSI